MSHWYTGTLLHWIPLHGYSVHSYFMFLHHSYIDSPVYMHWLSMYSCRMDHGLNYCYMYIPVFPLHDCILILILIFPLLDTWAVDMRCVESTSIISRFSLSYFMLSTELMSCYHVTCTMHCTYSYYAMYFKYNKDNMGMGRLDGWLDLIGWMYWIHIVMPTAGDGSAGYQLYIAPWSPVSRFLLPS